MSNQLKHYRTIDEEANYIAIVGRIPPPFGGVSVYLNRLLEKLLGADVPFYFFDLSGKSFPATGVYPGRNSAMWLLRFCLSSPHKLVHFHLSNSLALVMGGMLLHVRGRRFAITLHGEGVMHTACSGRFWIRLLLRWVLKRADRLFAVNPAVADWLLAIGIDEKRIIRMTPFLKPTSQETNINRLNKQLRRFLEDHHPVIGMQGWYGSYQHGQDLYRFDMVPPLIKQLERDYPKIGLCTAVSGTLDESYRQSIYELREAMGLRKRWLLIEGCGNAPALFKQCDMFIRPTMTDGDSVSVGECLYMGIPVLASDAVPRPHGCQLFACGDSNDLLHRCREILTNLPKYRGQLNHYVDESDNSLTYLLDYYRNLIS